MAQVLDIVDLLPTRSAGVIMRVPVSDAEVERLQQYVRNRPAWLARLRDAAGEDPLTAYAWLAFICGTSDAVTLTLDGVLAPVGAMRDLPLLKFKEATCFGLNRAKLDAADDARTRGSSRGRSSWASSPAGSACSTRRRPFTRRRMRGIPRWPILTLSSRRWR